MIHAAFFLLGLLCGSICNIVGLRVPKKESILYQPRPCPTCVKRLRPIELIPMLSFLLSKGKCRSCGESISPLYPVMEGITGLLFLLVFSQYGITWETLLGVLLVSFLVIITVSDLVYQLIPNRVLLPFFLLFLLLRFFHPYEGSFPEHLIGMAAGFLFFLLLGFISRGGMGGGDIKLFAVLGLFFPSSLLILTVMLSSLFGCLYGLYLFIIRRASRKKMVPFGPFIGIGAICSYLYGPAMISSYLSFIDVT